MIDDGRNGRLLSRACSSTIVIVSDDEWIGADLQLRIQPENEASLGRGHHVRGGEAANSGRVEAIWDGANERVRYLQYLEAEAGMGCYLRMQRCWCGSRAAKCVAAEFLSRRNDCISRPTRTAVHWICDLSLLSPCTCPELPLTHRRPPSVPTNTPRSCTSLRFPCPVSSQC